jgi:hypothetical protein
MGKKLSGTNLPGLLYFSRRPVPLSQGCEVARVLPSLDTGREHKFPALIQEVVSGLAEGSK